MLAVQERPAELAALSRCAEAAIPLVRSGEVEPWDAVAAVVSRPVDSDELAEVAVHMPTEERRCVCGASLSGAHEYARYCGKACRQRDWRRRQLEREREGGGGRPGVDGSHGASSPGNLYSSNEAPVPAESPTAQGTP